MNVVFLGLGGNIGNRPENLGNIIALLGAGCGDITRISGVYETDAWGSDSDKKYLNQVVQLSTSLSPEELLEKLLEIEEKLGRVRSPGLQNSDRTADIDILLYNDEIIRRDHLSIPHPRLHLRRFVLTPLCEIAPHLVHPLLKKNISALLKSCEDSLDVKKYMPGQNSA